MKKEEFQRLAKECAKFASEFDDERSVVVSAASRSNIRLTLYHSCKEEFGISIYADGDCIESNKAMESFFEKCKDVSHDA